MISTPLTALVILLGIALYPFFANHLPNQRQNAAAVIGVILLGIPILAIGPFPAMAHGGPLHSGLMVLSFLFFSSAFLKRKRGEVTAEKSAMIPFGIGLLVTALDAITNIPEAYLAIVVVQAICLLAITKTYSNLPKIILIKAAYFSLLYCSVSGLFHMGTLLGNPTEMEILPAVVLYFLLLGSTICHMAFQDFSRTRTKISWTDQARIDQDLMKMAFRSRRVLKDFRHDLRQPLSTLGILASVGKAISQDPEVTARYQHIQTAQKALKNMLEEFFDELETAIRFPSDDNQTSLELIAIDQVLSPLVEEYRMLANVKDLQIRYVPSNMEVMSNREALSKIIRNGLDNAIKYTVKGGVVVGVRRRNGRVCIQIVDTGSGVDSNKVAAHNKGWGHGSNIVRDLSEQIQAKTECKNRYFRGTLLGSVFEVMLPSENEILQRKKIPGPTSPSTFEAKVMAVDQQQLLEIQRHLPMLGFDKVEFSLLGAYKTYMCALRKGMSSVYIAYAGCPSHKQQVMDQLKLLSSLLDYKPCCILIYNAEQETNAQIEFTREMIKIPLNPKNLQQSLNVISELFPTRDDSNPFSAKRGNTMRSNQNTRVSIKAVATT